MISKFFSEFGKFLAKRNIVEMAVAFIIGSKVASLAQSFSNDLVTPILLQTTLDRLGIDNIDQLNWRGVYYGRFGSALLDLLIVTMSIFIMFKVYAGTAGKNNNNRTDSNT